MFVKNPGFTIAVVAALALGIGADTAIFSVVNTVLLKPLSYPEPDRIVQFMNTYKGGRDAGAAATEFEMWREQTNAFQDVAAYSNSGGMNLTGSIPEQVHGMHVTEAYFRLFGAQFIEGRGFTTAEDSPHGGNVVVISDELWKRRFGGDPNLAGKAISIANEPYTVVGVTGPQFDTDPAADLWLPYQFDPATKDQAHYFVVAGRMKPGVTLEQGRAQLGLAYSAFRRRFPEADPQNSFSADLLKDRVVSDVRSSLLVLIGAVSFVLLIACANVANLLMVRAAGRSREFAIRSALGAGRARIIRQLLTESVLLALTGGVLGLALGLERCAGAAGRKSGRYSAGRRKRRGGRPGLARSFVYAGNLAGDRNSLWTCSGAGRVEAGLKQFDEREQPRIGIESAPQQDEIAAGNQRGVSWRSFCSWELRCSSAHLLRCAW